MAKLDLRVGGKALSSGGKALGSGGKALGSGGKALGSGGKALGSGRRGGSRLARRIRSWRKDALAGQRGPAG